MTVEESTVDGGKMKENFLLNLRDEVAALCCRVAEKIKDMPLANAYGIEELITLRDIAAL